MELDGMLDQHEVEIFDIERPRKSMCKIHPCAWGVKTPEWKRVCALLETKPRILREFTRILRNGNPMRAELCTIDKPVFLDDICPEKNIQRNEFDGDCSKYDLVVDATGEKRAVLPSLHLFHSPDMVHACQQAMFKTHLTDLDISVFPAKGIGYAWVFPLNHPYVHIGYGSMKFDLGMKRTKELIEALSYAGVLNEEPVCGWHESKIRTMSPRYCRPITWGNIVGIGEAVGCTSPNNGAGILPGILSAELLANHLLDSSSNIFVGEPDYWKRLYEADLIRMFAFLDRETEILKKLTNHKRLGIRDYISLYRNCRYFGMYPDMMEVIRIFKGVGARIL